MRRKAIPSLRRAFQSQSRRYAATPPSNKPTPSKTSRIQSMLDRWIARSPKFMQRPLVSIRNSPASYIVSFAILHELTAVVPLAGLAAAFHYYQWLPAAFAEGKWAVEGVEKIGRWFRRRGWIETTDEQWVEMKTEAGQAVEVEASAVHPEKQDTLSTEALPGSRASADNTRRWVVEIGTAYAIVKFLVPARLFLSAVWAPWFATRILMPVGTIARRAGSIFKSRRS
jgi:hypothetical protein